MLYLESVDLFALIGLVVQAFAAWVFVVVLASISARDLSQAAFRSYLWAFVALAVSLTVMSARFLRVHGTSLPVEAWADGELFPRLCYAAYMGLKALFAALLVEGSHQLATGRAPRWIRSVRWPAAAVLAASPFVFPDINHLLVIQAPVLIAASAAALHALRTPGPRGSGLRLVRGALAGLAASWTLHAFAVLVEGRFGTGYVLSLNSFVDLGVQLTLGIGLVVCLLQEAHQRALAAEQEREALRRSIEKDERLRALGTVVSGVAHELNNPLTVILGNADMLRRAAVPDGAARVIAEQAERCRGIVRNLSALAGQSVHPRETLDLRGLVERVVRGLDAEAARRGRGLEVRPMAGLRGAVDRIGVEQVLANLVENALHATPPGGTVSIGAEARTGGVELWVADEGPGVPDELRERLFEPFFTTKAPGEGTGLGLSIAHAIVRGHGGTIAVDDAPGGRGAVFRVFFPDAEASPAPLPRAESPTVVGQRLLLIDDNRKVREVVRQHAEARGWEVSEVGTAEDALTASLADFGVILCDLRMPGMGGSGLFDRLQHDAPELLDRVVYFTGDLAAPESVRFAARCTRPLLHKPLDFDELFAILSEVAEVAAGRARQTR